MDTGALGMGVIALGVVLYFIGGFIHRTKEKKFKKDLSRPDAQTGPNTVVANLEESLRSMKRAERCRSIGFLLILIGIVLATNVLKTL